jgi:hypothetical protein
MPTPHNAVMLPPLREDRLRRAVYSRMRNHLRICIGSSILLALWLGVAIQSAPRGPTHVLRTSDRPFLLPMERRTEAGIHYGSCIGAVLTVMLFPEPCPWERLQRDRNVAKLLTPAGPR